MNAQEQFERLSREWADHCSKVRHSSNIFKYLDHPAYRQIVRLGPTIIPNIIAIYQCSELPWGFVLQDITGLRMIADSNAYSPAEMKQRWLSWWQEGQGRSMVTAAQVGGTSDAVETSARP